MSVVVVVLDPCKDTLDRLEQWREEARRGDLVGQLVVNIYRGQRYEPHVTGVAKRRPTHARGTLRSLEVLLDELISEP